MKGWTIYLNQPSLGGIVRPLLQTTTGLDGTYQFPGTTQGPFALSASKSDVSGGASGNGAINHEGQIVDVPLIATVTRQLFGRVQGLVLGATGSPPRSPTQLCHDDNCRSGVADADGAFGFDEVPLGRWNVLARSQTTASAGSVSADLLVDNDVADVRLVLGPLDRDGRRRAQQRQSRGICATDARRPKATCGNSTTCTRFADASGAFTYNELAAQQFSITAVDPITGLRGAVGGTLLAGENRSVRIVLQPTAQVTGRVFKANGSPADGVTVELHWSLPEVRSLFVATRADGRFTIAAAPMVAYEMTIEDPLGPGIARRTGQLIGDVDLGDMILDEAPPGRHARARAFVDGRSAAR